MPTFVAESGPRQLTMAGFTSLLTYYWPCRVARDGNGHYRISPFAIMGCDGTGASVEEATEAARAALVIHLKSRSGYCIVPPMFALEPDELLRGEVVRIQIDLSDQISY